MPRKKFPDDLFYQVFDLKRSRSDQRKIQILEAFIDSIASEGFDNTTFESLGKRVQMTRTHVNYYFQSRGDLIRTAVRYASAQGQSITIRHVQEAATWKDRLKAVVEGPFEWLERYPKHAPVMILFYYLCSYDRAYRELQSEIQVGGEKRIFACFQTLLESGKLTSRKATELSRSVQNLMTGSLINYFNSDYPLTLKALKDQTVRLAFELVAGV